MAIIDLGDPANLPIPGTSSIFGSLHIHNYLNDEQSVQDGQPVELYLFNKEDTDYWSYTSTDYNISYGGRNYVGALIRRGNITLNSNSLKTQLEIEVDLSNPFARLYIKEPIEGVVQLIIYRRHGNDYKVYWRGYVQGVKFKSEKIKIIAGLKLNRLRRGGLQRKFQRNCGLALYSTRCGIIESNYQTSATIDSVIRNVITATEFTGEVDGYFKGGIFRTDNGSCKQKIIYHVGATIKIARAVSAVSIGDACTVSAGCDHLKPTCKDKFGNKLNFGGQPYLPDKNPFTGDPVI